MFNNMFSQFKTILNNRLVGILKPEVISQLIALRTGNKIPIFGTGSVWAKYASAAVFISSSLEKIFEFMGHNIYLNLKKNFFPNILTTEVFLTDFVAYCNFNSTLVPLEFPCASYKSRTL